MSAQLVLEQLTDELQRHVLERQRRTVEQLEQVDPTAEQNGPGTRRDAVNVAQASNTIDSNRAGARWPRRRTATSPRRPRRRTGSFAQRARAAQTSAAATTRARTGRRRAPVRSAAPRRSRGRAPTRAWRRSASRWVLLADDAEDAGPGVDDKSGAYEKNNCPEQAPGVQELMKGARPGARAPQWSHPPAFTAMFRR